MKNYLLTIFGTEESEEAYRNMSQEDFQASLAQYMAYSQKLAESGRLVAAEGLTMNGATLKHDGNQVNVTDGPYILAKEMVGGFYLYKAESLQEAIELAKDCPALFHGSTVEVREQMEY
jgi:hypothetical protein